MFKFLSKLFKSAMGRKSAKALNTIKVIETISPEIAKEFEDLTPEILSDRKVIKILKKLEKTLLSQQKIQLKTEKLLKKAGVKKPKGAKLQTDKKVKEILQKDKQVEAVLAEDKKIIRTEFYNENKKLIVKFNKARGKRRERLGRKVKQKWDEAKFGPDTF